MSEKTKWAEGLGAAVTVTDAQGTILEMNERSRATFAKDGGGALVGRSVFDCHPERARKKLQELFERHTASHYTIRKNGQKKIVHQLPWFENGAFAGYVEISVPIPDEMPHYDRDAAAAAAKKQP
jgi:transcriptional regulator with PAS, ATPase and Fis domain